jgi:hypothetical protein
MTMTSPGPAGPIGASADPGAGVRREASVHRRAARLMLACGLLIAVVLPLAMAIGTGSISIPHNDAWSYSRIGQQFGRSGEIHLLQWNRSSLVGQIAVLGPLARYIAAQQVFVALLSVLALLACHDLLRPVIGQLRAAFATLVLAAWPELGLLSTSFMSDVPALTAVLGCLALGRRALASGSVPILAASLAVGLWGATIREQALAAPAAVLAVVLVGAHYRRLFGLRALLGLCVAFAVGLAAFELWRRSLAGDDPPADIPATAVLPFVADSTVRGYFLLAVAVSPAVLAVARPWRWSLRAWLAGAVAAGAALLCWHDHGLHGFLLTDYVTRSGPYPSAFMGNRTMLPDTAFRALVVLAGVSGVLLAGLVVERGRRLPPLLKWFLALDVGGLLASRAAGQAVFGRYLVVLIPALLCLLLAGSGRADGPGGDSRSRRFFERVWTGRPRVAVALAATASLAALSLLTTAYGSALDAARWDAGRRLVAAGVPATDVDAGFEWSGYHSPNGMDPRPVPDPLNWYSARFPDNRSCFAVYSSAQRHAGWRLVRTVPYRRFIIAGSTRLWVYDTGRCPS